MKACIRRPFIRRMLGPGEDERAAEAIATAAAIQCSLLKGFCMDNRFAAVVLALAGMALPVVAPAAAVSGNLTVQMVVGSGCSVGNATAADGVNNFGTIDFGSQASPVINYIDAQSAGSAGGNIQLICSDGTPYTVTLDGGQHASGTTRQMSNGTDNVAYALYQDAARSTPWGDGTTFGSAFTGTGTGAAADMNVYGRVPPQAAVSAGTYTDTVLVTVSW
jgi:spore coat protein U-like protein